MIMTYAHDDEPVQCLDFTADDRIPNRLEDALEDERVIVTAHNSQFDRNVLKHALGYDVAIERWRCTMMRAFLHGLPGGLDKLSDIFKLGDKGKYKEGHALMLFFCKPQKDGTRPTRLTHPEKWAGFLKYAQFDITSMRELDRLIPVWNMTDIELAYWFLDQRSNDRGVAVDVALAEAAIRAVDIEQKKLKKQTQELTSFDEILGEGLESTTQRDKMLVYMLEAYGVVLPDLQMATIERRLEDPDLPPELKELLVMRLKASTTSTRKYNAMIKAVNADGRVRGLIQFAGAFRTGRDAGRTVQPQNLPSRGLLPQGDINIGVRVLKLDAADLVFDNIMKLTSSTIRSCLVPSGGNKFVVADLANIEGRYLAWIAGEKWKLQAFLDFDDGIGEDIYKLAYAKSFQVPPETVDKEQRNAGKVQELMLGYGGGTGAYLTGAATYGMDLEAMAKVALDVVPEDVRKEAEGFYDWNVKQKRTTFGLSRAAYVTCDSFKRLWRRAHPMTELLWKEVEDGVRSAISSPERTFWYREFKFRRDGQWLRIIMPSGRALCYPFPQLDEKGGVSFMGVGQYTKKWERITTWGGKLVENLTQAGARDVFKHGERLAEENDYPVVLKVHDELVSDVPDTEYYSHEKLASFMATVPMWATGLPLAAEGFTTYAYRK